MSDDTTDPNEVPPIHDQLLKQLQIYFIANQKWEQTKSIKSGRKARFALHKIRTLAKARRIEIAELSKPLWSPVPNILKYNQDRQNKDTENDT